MKYSYVADVDVIEVISMVTTWTLLPNVAFWCIENLGYAPELFDPDETAPPRSNGRPPYTNDMGLRFESEDDFVIFKIKWL